MLYKFNKSLPFQCSNPWSGFTITWWGPTFHKDLHTQTCFPSSSCLSVSITQSTLSGNVHGLLARQRASLNHKCAMRLQRLISLHRERRVTWHHSRGVPTASHNLAMHSGKNRWYSPFLTAQHPTCTPFELFICPARATEGPLRCRYTGWWRYLIWALHNYSTRLSPSRRELFERTHNERWEKGQKNLNANKPPQVTFLYEIMRYFQMNTSTCVLLPYILFQYCKVAIGLFNFSKMIFAWKEKINLFHWKRLTMQQEHIICMLWPLC